MSEIAVKSLFVWSAQSLKEQRNFCSVGYIRIMFPIIRKELQICNYWLIPAAYYIPPAYLSSRDVDRDETEVKQVVLQYLKKSEMGVSH